MKNLYGEEFMENLHKMMRRFFKTEFIQHLINTVDFTFELLLDMNHSPMTVYDLTGIIRVLYGLKLLKKSKFMLNIENVLTIHSYDNFLNLFFEERNIFGDFMNLLIEPLGALSKKKEHFIFNNLEEMDDLRVLFECTA